MQLLTKPIRGSDSTPLNSYWPLGIVIDVSSSDWASCIAGKSLIGEVSEYGTLDVSHVLHLIRM